MINNERKRSEIVSYQVLLMKLLVNIQLLLFSVQDIQVKLRQRYGGAVAADLVEKCKGGCEGMDHPNWNCGRTQDDRHREKYLLSFFSLPRLNF